MTKLGFAGSSFLVCLALSVLLLISLAIAWGSSKPKFLKQENGKFDGAAYAKWSFMPLIIWVCVAFTVLVLKGKSAGI